jgi:hypothetical protein
VKTLVLDTDGPSDRVLKPLIEWLVRETAPSLQYVLEHVGPRDGVLENRGLNARLERTLKLFPACSLLLVHRDAEKADWPERQAEVDLAITAVSADAPHVPVIPVRMTEAWFLFDEAAIRRAAGNPGGEALLDLPSLSRVESVADPKEVLQRALEEAAHPARRGRRSGPSAGVMYANLANHIRDFSPLRALPAFQRLESDLARALVALA